MDEPASALDPIATARIEEFMIELKASYTIVIVTHNMQQAARVSDDTAFMLLGDLVEAGNPDHFHQAGQHKNRAIYFWEIRIMQRRFDGQIQDLSQKLVRMGRLAESMLQTSMRC